MPDMVEVMRRVAQQTQDYSKPVSVLFGTVEALEPLAIVVEQKLRLGPEQLVLTRSVTDYELPVTLSGSTGSAEGHSHGLTGSRTLTVKGALQVGETVLLLRQSGGQKFVVMDRVVSA